MIAGFFSDEPGFYNQENYGYDNYIGRQMPLPWGRELEEVLLQSYGGNLYRDLPLLFSDHDDKSHRGLRVAYMNAVSTLYGKNFTAQLGNWCQAHGVEYIGHVVEDYNGYMRLGAGIGHYFTLFGGSVVIETIFRWPGLGKLAMDAITNRDYPVIQGFVLFTSTVYVVINLLIDICYSWVDPRLRKMEGDS